MSISSSPQSLLTQRERHAFHSFLSTMSHTDAESGSIPAGSDANVYADWQMYSHLGMPLLQAEGSDSLSKATKDLISLHPPKFSEPTPPVTAQQQQPRQAQHGHRHIAPAPGPSTPYLLPSSMRNTAHQPPTPSISNTQAARPTPPKRARTSPSDSKSSSRLSPSPPLPHVKTTLLSAQQKKANHIQSEQKRRANIRRGYEALCDTVPSLQEAIHVEEEGSGNTSNGGGGSGGVGRRKRAKGEDGERADGRAGPRSESVVLQKTIEHIQALLDDKAALMSRLERARVMLGPGHPVLYSNTYLNGKAPWERDWDGGKGLMDVNGEEESDDE